MAKISKPVMYLGIVAGIAAVWIFLNPGDTPAGKRAAHKAPTTSVSSKQVVYTQEDYTAKFTPVNITAKNAFKPIIARRNPLQSPEGPSGIPPALAGGEAGWTYTGTVEVDGVVQALLENPTTGAGQFVKVGETWKNARVMEINGEKIVLSGPAGTALTVRLHGPEEAAAPPTGMAPARVQPPLTGRIGALSVRPIQGNQQGQAAAAEGNGDGN